MILFSEDKAFLFVDNKLKQIADNLTHYAPDTLRDVSSYKNKIFLSCGPKGLYVYEFDKETQKLNLVLSKKESADWNLPIGEKFDIV